MPIGFCGRSLTQRLSTACNRRNCLCDLHADPGRQRRLHGHHEVPTGQHSGRSVHVLSGGNGVAHRETSTREKGIADWIALSLALGVAAFEVTFAIQAAISPTGHKYGYPPGPYIMFGTMALLAVAGDLRMLLGSGVSGIQRIARHLWRMCFAWFITSASIFLARPHLFPAIMRKSGALIFLTVLPLILLVFWMVRVKYSEKFRKTVSSSSLGRMPLPASKQVSAG